MEGTGTITTALHRFSPFFSISSHSNLSLCNKSPLTKTPFKSTNGFLSLRAVNSAVKDKRPNPNRSASAVRLLRIEQGGAFADLLNDKGKNSGENEMGYVERTLGLRTRDLDDRDISLVTNSDEVIQNSQLIDCYHTLNVDGKTFRKVSREQFDQVADIVAIVRQYALIPEEEATSLCCMVSNTCIKPLTLPYLRHVPAMPRPGIIDHEKACIQDFLASWRKCKDSSS